MLTSQLGNQVHGNQIANLTQNGELTGGWIDPFFLFHPCRVAGLKTSVQPFFIPLWDDCAAKNQTGKRLFLEHTILIADVMIGLELACQKSGNVRLIEQDEILSLLPAKFRKDADFPRWNVTVRHQQKSIPLPVVPDKVFGLQFSDNPNDISFFFLEADCGSMPAMRNNLNQSSFHRKLLAYHATWKQGVFKDSLNRFRVLTVTPKNGRLQTLISAAGRLPDGHGLFLFADKLLFKLKNPLHEALQTGHGQSVSLLPISLPAITHGKMEASVLTQTHGQK